MEYEATVNDNVIELAQQLIAIDSVNPSLVPGGAGEAELAGVVAAWLEARSFEVRLVDAEGGRPSVIGIRRGTGGGRSLLLNGHLDTVTLSGYDGDPLAAVLRDGRLYGRGSYDMKGAVAAMLVAAATAAGRPLGGDIIVTCVADEEDASSGTRAVLELLHADAAIVVEPTELALATAHRGFIWATVQTHGVAAHGSRPELGVDAIAKMGRFLVALEALDHELRAHPAHPLLGSGSVHASLITGGAERSSYPAACVLELERRTIPGETSATLLAELQALVAACRRHDNQFEATVELGLHREPFETPPGAPIVDVLSAAAAAVVGAPPPHRGASFWADAALLQASGIPTVMFGPSGAGAHAALEYVEVASLERLAEILTRAIDSFCA